jgi:serine/threonine protein kinase
LSQEHYPFALPIGTVISGYEIVRVLGVGGFGITYEGFNPVTRRRAAIKEFFPRGIASRENATQVVF